jgi:hypothetical protein
VPAGFSLPYQPLAFRQHHLFEATVQRLLCGRWQRMIGFDMVEELFDC